MSRQFKVAAALGIIALLPDSSLGSQTPLDSAAADFATKVEVRVNGRPVKGSRVLSGDISLDTVILKVRHGDDVKSLLKQHGVVPDASALSVFYELNPGIHNADELTVGKSVNLPVWRMLKSDAAAVNGRLGFCSLERSAELLAHG